MSGRFIFMAVLNYLLDENGNALEVFPYADIPSMSISEHLGAGFWYQFTSVYEIDWLIDQLEEAKEIIERKENTQTNATT